MGGRNAIANRSVGGRASFLRSNEGNCFEIVANRAPGINKLTFRRHTTLSRRDIDYIGQLQNLQFLALATADNFTYYVDVLRAINAHNISLEFLSLDWNRNEEDSNIIDSFVNEIGAMSELKILVLTGFQFGPHYYRRICGQLKQLSQVFFDLTHCNAEISIENVLDLIRVCGTLVELHYISEQSIIVETKTFQQLLDAVGNRPKPLEINMGEKCIINVPSKVTLSNKSKLLFETPKIVDIVRRYHLHHSYLNWQT